MQGQATRPRNGVVVATGYGLKVYVERGHLLVHDGIGSNRRTRRFARVYSNLKRLVVLGKAGYVTLEALKWLQDIGAAFVHIDSDGCLVSTTVGVATDQPQLRRAQALAPESHVGLEIARDILFEKIAGQGHLLSELKGGGDRLAWALEAVRRCSKVDELLAVEAAAALDYWAGWRNLEVRFGSRDRNAIPEHWLTFGQRHSPLSGSPRLAVDPPNAILNYLYSLLEAEAVIGCQAVGLDAGLGIFHRDRRARASLALDAMEACRPTVDAYLLALLRQRTVRKRDFVETRRGACRLLPELAKELASTSGAWGRRVAPVVERVAGALAEGSGDETLATPRTGAGRRRAGDGSRRKPTRAASLNLSLPATCRRCATELPDRRRRLCDGCRRNEARKAAEAGRRVAAAVLTQLREEGRDPAHGGDIARRRGQKNRAHQAAVGDWNERHPQPDRAIFATDVAPGLRQVSTAQLVDATGLSEHYCSLIRLGKRVPHPRHWDALRRVASSPPADSARGSG